ncbi:excalibur calcium-binding domain-containing protein [Arthrobacter sp. B0490]|uniref:excalibur calcium-binding domain-containing protein n=1 Tax=Arthrobacter sp. B0490 TaxID=2058891 RepID=UPI000CE2DE24|nr:excalibur calcium-binding domain-containing protein [Arthrobacter sp. B0490]
MKNIAVGATLVAAGGCSILSVAPAIAAPYPYFFQTCAAAASYGVYNMPVGSPGYAPYLDTDGNGIACENANVAYDVKLVPPGDTDLLGDPTIPVFFQDCAEAALYGLYNIPVGSRGYVPDPDTDGDGILCENADIAYDESLVPLGYPDVVRDPTAPVWFQDCAAAASYGLYNIPIVSHIYSPNLDTDRNGIGCENADIAYDASLVPLGRPDVMGEPTPDDAVGQPLPPTVEIPQVTRMPVGGADTGVSQATTHNKNALALGGGLALMAASGAMCVVRRRTAKV